MYVAATGPLGFIAAFLAASCVPATFVCQSDSQCVSSSVQGVCEANGRCSYPDADCPSGYSYEDLAGDGVGGSCVPIAGGGSGGTEADGGDTQISGDGSGDATETSGGKVSDDDSAGEAGTVAEDTVTATLSSGTGGASEGSSFTTDDPTSTSANSSGASTDMSGSAGSSDGGGAQCGNGVIELFEECDDFNAGSGDGCSSQCQEEPNHVCSGEPSVCLEYQVDTISSFTNVTIPDDGYDGTLASMACRSLTFNRPSSTVESVEVVLGINHNYIGDLTAKVVSPQGTVVTLFSRPGLAESADNGTSSNGAGDTSNLVSSDTIRFRAGGSDNPETMGNTLSGSEEVCRDDGRCIYGTNPGAAAAGTLGSFAGQTASGTWRICVGDAFDEDVGEIDSATLQLETLGPP